MEAKQGVVVEAVKEIWLKAYEDIRVNLVGLLLRKKSRFEVILQNSIMVLLHYCLLLKLWFEFYRTALTPEVLHLKRRRVQCFLTLHGLNLWQWLVLFLHLLPVLHLVTHLALPLVLNLVLHQALHLLLHRALPLVQQQLYYRIQHADSTCINLSILWDRSN